MTPEILNDLLREANRLTTELVARSPVSARDIPFTPGRSPDNTPSLPPRTGGVYLIFKNDGIVIYAGKANNLRKRICRDHLSAGTRIGKDFRDRLAASEGLTVGWDLRRWLCENCSFSWIEIPRPEMYNLVESLLIAWLKAEKHTLFND